MGIARRSRLIGKVLDAAGFALGRRHWGEEAAISTPSNLTRPEQLFGLKLG
jgi:hypothetical protein